MKKRGVLSCQWEDNGRGAAYSCLVVEDPSTPNKTRYVMHRFDTTGWPEPLVAGVQKCYAALVERNSSSPAWSGALRVLNSATQSHYFNIVGEYARLGTFAGFLSRCIADGARPRRVGSIAAGYTRWMPRIATSLQTMHEHGAVHGDVRLGSIFLNNHDSAVVSGEDPDIGDLDALMLGCPMPFPHAFTFHPDRRRKAPTPPPPPPAPKDADTSGAASAATIADALAAIEPVHDALLQLMRMRIKPPEMHVPPGGVGSSSSSSSSAPMATPQSDVYMFGYLLGATAIALRMFLHGTKTEIGNCNPDGIMRVIGAAHHHQPRWRNLVASMLSPDPASRPTMRQVLKEMVEIDMAPMFSDSTSLANSTHSSLGASGNNHHGSAPPTPDKSGAPHPSSVSSLPVAPLRHGNAVAAANAVDEDIIIHSDDNANSSSSNNNGTDPSSTAAEVASAANRRSIAEARQRQRLQQQQKAGSAAANSDAPRNGSNPNDSAWLQSAEERLKQLEHFHQQQQPLVSQANNSKKKSGPQQQQQQQKQQQHFFDPEIEHSPPAKRVNQVGINKTPPRVSAGGSSATSAAGGGAATGVGHSPLAANRPSSSPEPTPVVGLAPMMNVNNNKNQPAARFGPQPQQAQQQQQRRPTTVNDLRHMRKNEKHAALARQEVQMEERREQFLNARMERERAAADERRLHLERQRQHAAHLKQIKSAKRGIVEAVMANQQAKQLFHHHHHHHHDDHNNNNNNNNEVAEEADGVQIFVKRGGQVMRCDDGTGFIPMTEEQHKSPDHRNRLHSNHKNNHHPSTNGQQQQQQQHKHFHPQVYQREAEDNSSLNGTATSVRMAASESGGENLGVTTSSTLSRTLASNEFGDEDDGDDTHRQRAAAREVVAAAVASAPGAFAVEEKEEEGNVVSVEKKQHRPPPARASDSPPPVPPGHFDDDETGREGNLAQDTVDGIVKSLRSTLGNAVVAEILAEVEVFAKAPVHVRCHPRANAVFSSRIRNLVESSTVPRLAASFGVSSEEEGFAALLVMLGQVVCSSTIFVL